MGNHSTSEKGIDGQHFNDLLNAKQGKQRKQDVDDDDSSVTSEQRSGSATASSAVRVNPRARILQHLSADVLWDNFLGSSHGSFALTPSEASDLLRISFDTASDALEGKENSHSSGSSDSIDPKQIDEEVKSYLALIAEITEKDSNQSKAIDYMAMVSSVLFLSLMPIERKIDTLFDWIVLSDVDNESAYMNFDDFYVALRSFERGLSHAMGHAASSEAFVKQIAQDWFKLANPHALNDPETTIDKKQFFALCTNRQYPPYPVRKLLELLAQLHVQTDDDKDHITDVVAKVANAGSDDLFKGNSPSGGDEFMANPAWKKTAEKMLPRNKYFDSSKPSDTLELEWVHGYRGFDCRNNLFSVSTDGSQTAFTAAALAIVQTDRDDDRHIERSQKFFGEHSDDIISFAVHLAADSGAQQGVLMASGEIGRSASIHLYSWLGGEGEGEGSFSSLASMSGFHTKGVAQLVFSADGARLFSVGVEYTVAIYNTNNGTAGVDKHFGKMLLSGQGPKGKVLHVCAGDDNSFVSVGEKHICVWTVDKKKNKLVCTDVRLAQLKQSHKDMMCCGKGPDGAVVVGTSDGDLLLVKNTKLVKKLQAKAHSKAAYAITCRPDNELFVTGGRDGTVKVWRWGSNDTISPIAVQMLDESVVLSKPLHLSENGSQTAMQFSSPIRALSTNPTGTCLLIGTQECEVVRLNMREEVGAGANTHLPIVDAKTLIAGHYKDELWGLAVRPSVADGRAKTEGEYATVGDDGKLRIWSISEKCNTFMYDLATDEGRDMLNMADASASAGSAVTDGAKGGAGERGSGRRAGGRMGAMARCCAYSPDGTMLAVGFGGSVGRGKNKEDGIVRIYRHATDGEIKNVADVIMKVQEIKEAKQWISAIKFSPDGSTLAVGSRDNSIYLYSVSQQFKRKAKFSKHNAGINQFDFTSDGCTLQSCCSAYEILFSNTAKGSQISKGTEALTNASWDSWTCTLGWPVIGIWKGGMDGSDINACDRSPSGRLLATADDFGKVNLYRYPCTREDAECTVYSGHSSHVTNVRWAKLNGKKGANILLSTGGNDKCVFQWRCSGSGERSAGGALNSHTLGDKESVAVEPEKAHDDDLFAGGPAGGDEFCATKAWLGAIVAPTAWSSHDPTRIDPFQAALGEFGNQHHILHELDRDRLDLNSHSDGVKEWRRAVLRGSVSDAGFAGERFDYQEAQGNYDYLQKLAEACFVKMSDSGFEDKSAPDSDDLELEWVHGIRSFDTRNNVKYFAAKNRQVVYHAAALGIVMDPTAAKQRYFRGHTDDIMGLATFTPSTSAQHNLLAVPLPDGDGGAANMLVATGQQGKGKTFIWDANTLSILSTLETKQKSVHMLSFSADGRLLLTIAEDKSVAVSDWKVQRVLASTKGESADTYGVCAAGAAASGKGEVGFLSVGDKHVRFWVLKGRNLSALKVSTAQYKLKGFRESNPRERKPGQPKKCDTQRFLCAVAVADKFIIGAEDGCLYVANTKKVISGFSHHSVYKQSSNEWFSKKFKKFADITAIYHDDVREILVTGAKNGTVCLWSTSGLKESETAVPTWLTYFELDKQGGSEAGGNRICIPFLFAKTIQSVSLLGLPEHADRQTVEEECLVLVTTRGCDLVEVRCTLPAADASASPLPPQLAGGDAMGGGVLMQSHCNDELWGVATHPKLPEYCTVGDDRTLRFYSIAARRMVAAMPLGNMARAVAYSPVEPHIVAVGFGGRVGRGKESGGGIVRLYPSYSDPSIAGNMAKLDEQKHAKEWISDVKFSSDGATLAVGAHDCKIYIYDVSVTTADKKRTAASLKIRTQFVKHNSVINHIDLSVDGRFMQSNCSAYELLFCDTTNGKQVTKASELKDVKWGTWTCTLGWPVQGIWAPGMDGSDINATARSHSGHLIATSDDMGKVNLFRYPCTVEGASFNAYSGHSSHVTNVRWTVADECLLSCGGNDKCLFQWRHHIAEASGSGGIAMSRADALKDDDMTVEDVEHDDHFHDLPPAYAPKTAAVSDSHHKAADATHGHAHTDSPFGSLFDGGGPSGGDEAGAVKPWVGAIKTPANPPFVNPSKPAVSMQLEWVHGYTSGRSAANTRVSMNLFYNSERDVVYPTASLGVMLSRPHGTSDDNVQSTPDKYGQTFFKGHNDDILCLTMSPDRRYVATGQTANREGHGKAGFCVWDASDGQLLCRMDGCHQRGVMALKFSPDGSRLLSVGMDNKNTHILWTDNGGGWSRVTQTAVEPGDQNPVYFATWVNEKNEESTTDYKFVTGGKSVLFWNLQGAKLSRKQGRFGKKYKQCPLLCAANLHSKDGWRMAMGAATGDIYMFHKREVVGAAEKAHSGHVLALAESGPNCQFLVSGGADKCVKIWNQSLQPISSFEITPALAVTDCDIAALDVWPHPLGKQRLCILAGTQGGDIIEIITPVRQQKPMHPQHTKPQTVGVDTEEADPRDTDLSGAEAITLLHSHSKGELWGVATHPTDPDIVASVGDDATLRVWSISKKCMLHAEPLHWPARSVAWHPSGKLLAVGFHESVKGGYNRSGNSFKAGKKARKKQDAKEGSEYTHKGAVHLFTYSNEPVSSTPLGVSVKTEKIAAGCDSIAWIADVKFNYEGTQLAVGSHDKHLYVYSIPAEVPRDESSAAWADWGKSLLTDSSMRVFDKHSSAVLHVDFSVDGEYIQSNDQAGELLFSFAKESQNRSSKGAKRNRKIKQETSASKVADYNGILDDDTDGHKMWSTHTSVLGWPVQGVWSSNHEYEGLNDVNAMDRHCDGKLLAVGDDMSNVKIYRYPCVEERSRCVLLSGHSSHVTNVRWTNKQHLVSAGGNDKSLMFWSFTEE